MVLIEDEIDFAKKINKKLGGYRETDKHKKARYPLENTNLKTITKKDIIKLVNDLDTDLCRGCGCKMLFCNYAQFCIYQFSLDRIDNKKIHSINNLRIVCWNCNSSGYGSMKCSCSRGCHENLENDNKRLIQWNSVGRTEWCDIRFIESGDHVKL